MAKIRFSGLIGGSVLLLSGCGGSSGTEGATGTGTGAGTVTDAWAGYCTGTFTEDTAVMDPFGEVMFTARTGQEYLLAEYGDTSAELVYLTNAGPETFSVEADASGAFPFISSCEPNQGVDYYAVFTDVTVYAEEALTTEICDLAAGTALPVAGAAYGYAAAGGFSLEGPATYEIILNAFSAQCGGAERGYISVPQTEVLGTQTWLVPIIGIIGPD